MDRTQQRNYGVDLFRIVSMIMVVGLHVLGRGGVLGAAKGDFPAYALSWWIETACYGAVNCFALVSGFVGLRSRHKFSNLAYLWIQVVFTMLLMQTVDFIFVSKTFSRGKLLVSFIPIFSRYYWYFTDYAILFLLMPMLNAAVNNLSKKTISIMIMLVGAIFCASAFFPGPVFEKDPFQIHSGYSAMWLAYVYLIGAFVAKYGLFEKLKSVFFLLIYFGSVTLAWGSKFLLERLPDIVTHYISANSLIKYNSPLILISALALLLFFVRLNNMPRFVCGIIGFVSPLTFGVYIIHLHELVWEWLAKRFVFLTEQPLHIMLLGIVAAIAAIFVGCMILDCARHYLFKLLRVRKALNAIENKIMKEK